MRKTRIWCWSSFRCFLFCVQIVQLFLSSLQPSSGLSALSLRVCFFFFTTLLRLLSGIFLLINFMLAERVWAFGVVAVELTCALFIYWWSSTVRCAAIHTRSHYTHTHDQRTTNIRKHSHFTHTHLHTLYRYAHLSMHAINLAPRVCRVFVCA